MFTHANAQQTAKITSSGIGYLEYLPSGYSSSTNKYPVVISLHGIKERGTTSTDPTTLKQSVLTVANVGLPKYVKYGQQYPFILISPQLKSSYGTWPADYVMSVINYVKTYLRIDPNRIYLTGLSLGGYGVWKTAGAYPEVFASIVPICSGGNALSQACDIAAENLPVWAFHGDADGTVSYTVTTKMVTAINNCSPKPNPLAKVTLFPGLGHVIWDKVYKETSALNWMLSYTNNTTSTTTNATPTVSAGGDKSLILPTNYVALQGSASDADGTIASYQWSKISGSTATLSGTTSSKLNASNLVAGSYYFRLTVKDNKGATKSDDVKVTVNSSNIAPVAKAGSDKTIGTTSTKLYGSGTDADGTIAYYKWKKISGPSSSINYVSTPTLSVTSMLDGTYVFQLTVTDNKGATGSDQVKVIVTAGTAQVIENPAPIFKDADITVPKSIARGVIPADAGLIAMPYRKSVFSYREGFVLNVMQERRRLI